MTGNRLEIFIVKKAVILSVFPAAAVVAFLGSHRWPLTGGLLAGALISIGRFYSNEWIIKRIFKTDGKKAAAGSIAAFTASQSALIPVIALTYFLSTWVFYGLIAGILVVPFVVMVNSITEAVGITKNNFE